MIHLLIPYFGKFPNYFQLYLDSVANNADILHIIFITDIDTTIYNFPQNTTIINKSFEDVRRQAYEFLLKEFNRPIDFNNLLKIPYKLTDFRPLIPTLFKDILQNIPSTHYIGWGDCDVILGQLSKFIDISKHYDLIGRHGHFTAFRNREPYLSLYKQLDRMLDRLMDERCMYVEEHQWAAAVVIAAQKNNGVYFKFDNSFCDITPWQWMPNETKELTLAEQPAVIINYMSYDSSTGELTAYFQDGRIQATSYVHLQKRKMIINFEECLHKFYIHKESFELTPTME
jgi:hypothetical protein